MISAKSGIPVNDCYCRGALPSADTDNVRTMAARSSQICDRISLERDSI